VPFFANGSFKDFPGRALQLLQTFLTLKASVGYLVKKMSETERRIFERGEVFTYATAHLLSTTNKLLNADGSACAGTKQSGFGTHSERNLLSLIQGVGWQAALDVLNTPALAVSSPALPPPPPPF
jgi:hypothetical protein